jgi:DNA-binding response OmpR family regulator
MNTGTGTARTPLAAGFARILVVEDDEGIRDMLKYHLASAGFSVLEAADGTTGLRAARTGKPDLILLDLMLPGMGGLELCRAVRKTSRVPILVISARDAEIDKIVGLELGADDYITKPFSVREVVARVNAVLRRSRSEGERSIPERDEFGNFAIDRAARRVTLDGQEVRLTAREFDLLSHLLASAGRVQSRERLLQEVWGDNFSGESKTVDVHIRWLREKFAEHAPFTIVTVRGSGYRLDRPAEAVTRDS